MKSFKKSVHQVRPGRRLIMGKNCLQELFSSYPERIKKVYSSRDVSEDPLLRSMEKKGILISYVSKNALDELVNSDSHQGFVAETQTNDDLTVKDFLTDVKEESFVLALDSIFDPQNFGAILRAAECFQVDAVLYSKNRGTSITPVVTKASVGASELVPLISVANLAESLGQLQKNDFSLVTAEVGVHAVSLTEFSFPKRTALVLGSEGEGIQKLISNRADHHLYIPMLGKIDSLNVSQAAAVLLAHWRLSNT